MALPPCDPCECIPGNIPDDKFKQDVVNVLCQTLTTLGYEFPEDACDPCACIQGNIPNDKFKQDVEILLCLILANIGGGGGGGSVTSFSFNDANGFSGVVTNAATTPELTLTLDPDAVSFAQIQNIATARLLGRATAGSGNIEEITLGTGLSFAGTTLNAAASGGTVTSVSVTTANGVSGSVATATTTPAITLTLGAITPSSVAAVGTVTGSNLSGTNTGDQTITLTGDVTGSGTGSFAATIANDAVTYAKMQNVSAASRLLGRGSAGGAGDVEELTISTGLTLTGTVLTAAGSGGDVVGPGSAVNNNLAAFDGTTGKLIKDSGLLTSTVATASSSTVFTNKTFDADGTGNSITNIENADIKAAAAIAVNKLAALTASRVVVSDASGFLTVSGVTSAQLTALLTANKFLAHWRCDENQPPAANFATLDTRNSIPVLNFDTTTQEGSVFGGVMPSNYLGGNIQVYVIWAAATATTGTIGWDATFETIADGGQDIDSDGWATAQPINAATVPGTSGIVTVTFCSCTAGGPGTDSVAALDKFRLRIRRDVVSDSAAGDAQLLDVYMLEV